MEQQNEIEAGNPGQTENFLPTGGATCSVVDRVTAIAWDKLAIQEAIEATHPCRMETHESYASDALAMELIHKRHDKREIVNLIRWCLMGCPPNENSAGTAAHKRKTI
jgi:hypothetical protein